MPPQSWSERITPLILTLNEAPNIGRVLERLAWAKRIVVVDSGSTDETLVIAARHPAIVVVPRTFDSHAEQWNFGLANVQSDWVMSLDCDYVLDPAAADELGSLDLDGTVAGYEASFIYCIYGRPLRGTLYPPRTILFRKSGAAYINEGHTQRLHLEGAVRPLRLKVRHDDRKSLQRWFASQQAYARREAEFLLSLPAGKANVTQRLRRLGFLSPFLIFFYTLIVKRCLLDGWPGWFYVLQRTVAEMMITTAIVDRRLEAASRKDDAQGGR